MALQDKKIMPPPWMATKELKEMVSYIKKNGIKVYGFTTIADKETLLKLSKQSEVYEIYTEEVR